VHPAIFPAIRKIKAAQDAGQPRAIAVATAVPDLVKAMSRGMACRELCEAVISTCSCSSDPAHPLSFGEAVTAAEAQNESFKKLGLTHLDQDFKSTVFRDIWDKPLCHIFTPKDDPDFGGLCPTVAPVCGDNSFCADLGDSSRTTTEAIIAAQIAHSVFGFVDGPTGLLKQSDTVGKVLPAYLTYPYSEMLSHSSEQVSGSN
jgi:hypothetical protein